MASLLYCEGGVPGLVGSAGATGSVVGVGDGVAGGAGALEPSHAATLRIPRVRQIMVRILIGKKYSHGNRLRHSAPFRVIDLIAMSG
jgi:hypothetical protein